MNSAIICGGAGDAKAVIGQSDNRAAATRHGNRLVEDIVLALSLLLHRLGFLNQINEVLRGSIQNRRLTGIHLNQHIIHATAVERTQHMLHGMHFGMAIRYRGAPHEVFNAVDQRLELRLAVQIDPTKNDAVVFRCRL